MTEATNAGGTQLAYSADGRNSWTASIVIPFELTSHAADEGWRALRIGARMVYDLRANDGREMHHIDCHHISRTMIQ